MFISSLENVINHLLMGNKMNEREKVKKLEEHYNYFEISELLGLCYEKVRFYSETQEDYEKSKGDEQCG